MTEYKKLVSLVDALKENVELLYAQCDTSEHTAKDPGSLSTEDLFNLASEVGSAVVTGTPRIAKIVAKARETDPNRQIYNEMMCGKIEDLFENYVGVVYRLLYGTSPERRAQANEEGGESQEADPLDEREEVVKAAVLEGGDLPLDDSAVLIDVERKYDAELLCRAAAEAWAGRVAEDLSQLVLFEHQNRQVVEAGEKQNRAALTEEKRKDKGVVLGILQLLADAKHGAEIIRRAKEKAWLTEAARQVKVDALGDFLASRIPYSAVRRNFALHLRSLCSALLLTPEDGNIRRLRCNNQHMIEDYGHCCLPACPATSGHDARCCNNVNEAAEVLWCLLGYRVQYTAHGSWGLPALLQCGKLHEAKMPCGGVISAHEYRSLGYEEYSERLFELREPNPATEPDLWMEWFDRVGKVATLLESEI